MKHGSEAEVEKGAAWGDRFTLQPSGCCFRFDYKPNVNFLKKLHIVFFVYLFAILIYM